MRNKFVAIFLILLVGLSIIPMLSQASAQITHYTTYTSYQFNDNFYVNAGDVKYLHYDKDEIYDLWYNADVWCANPNNDTDYGTLVYMALWVESNTCSGGDGTYVWTLVDGQEDWKQGIWIPNGWTGYFIVLEPRDVVDYYNSPDDNTITVRVSNESISGSIRFSYVRFSVSY